MISRQLLDNYTNAINKISASAQNDIGNALKNLDVSDVSAAREATISVMDEYLATYTDATATLGARFYDACRESELGAGVDGGALVDSMRNPDATHGAVKAFMQTVVDGGDAESLIEKCLDRVDYEIKVAANKSVLYAGSHDSFYDGSAESEYTRLMREQYGKGAIENRGKAYSGDMSRLTTAQRNRIRYGARKGGTYGVRYARVPSGGETCRFCIMLASRGAVYWTDEAASHCHSNCDCRTVPSFSGETPNIEGYDVDEYKNQYKEMLKGHELEEHYDLQTINGRTTNRMYKTAAYDYGSALNGE